MLSKHDITDLIAHAYYEAACVDNCDMRLVAGALEGIRDKILEADPFFIWDDLLLSPDKFSSKEILTVLVKLKESYNALLWKNQLKELQKFYASDKNSAVEKLFAVFSKAAVTYQSNLIHKLYSILSQWERNDGFNAIKKFEKLPTYILDERWVETVPVFQAISDNERNSVETRSFAIATMIEIILYYYPQISSATPLIERIQSLSPQSIVSTRVEGEYYLALKESQKARDSFLKVISQKPSDYISFNFIGDCFWEEGSLENAEFWYHEAMKKNCLQIESYLRLINLYSDKRWFKEKQQKVMEALRAIENMQGIVNDAQARLTQSEKENTFIKEISTYQAYRRIGSAWYKNENLPEAIIWYSKASETNPELTSATIDLGYLNTYLKNFDEAYNFFSKAISVDADNYDAQWALGFYYSEIGDIQSSINAYNKCLQIRPGWSDSIYNMMGNAYLKQKLNKNGIEYYQKSISLNPTLKLYKENLAEGYTRLIKELEDKENFQEAEEYYRLKALLTNSGLDWNGLGNHFFARQRWNEAIESYDKAMKADNSEPVYYENKALAYSEINNFEAAEKNFKQANEIRNTLNKSPGISSFKLGQFYLNHKMYKEAENYILQAISSDKENLDYLDTLCFLYEQTAQNEKAKSYYEKILEIKPDHDGALNGLGVIYYKQGNFDLALKNYLNAIQINPNAWVYYDNTGLVYEKTCRYAEAIKYYKNVLTFKDNDPDMLSRIGKLYYYLGLYEEAKSLYEKAIKINPKNFIYFTNLGQLYRNKLKYDEALKYYRQALELNPDDFYAWNEIGIIFYVQKNYQESIKSYQRAISLKPDDPQLYQNLALAYVEAGNEDKALDIANYKTIDKNTSKRVKDFLIQQFPNLKEKVRKLETKERGINEPEF